MEFQIEIVTTSKANRCLFVNNYRYYHKRSNYNASSLYICSVPKCNSTVTISGKEEILKIYGKKKDLSVDKLKNCHDHKLLTDVEKLVNEVKSKLKTQAENNLDIQKVYWEERNKFKDIVDDEDLVASKFPQLLTVKSSMYRARSKNIPNIPSSLDAFDNGSNDGLFLKQIIILIFNLDL